MFAKDLKTAYLQVVIETKGQLQTVVRRTDVDLIFLDVGMISEQELVESVKMIRKGSGGIGKLAGFRLPQLFRARDRKVLENSLETIREANPDAFLARCAEEVLWLKENGFPEERIMTDHTMYLFQTEAEKAQTELLGKTGARTFPLELNAKELKAFSAKIRKMKETEPHELVVYGRVPLMITAQCLRKTAIGCDKRPSVIYLKDRTGAVMPVFNCCRFCQNTIYNALPTVLYDLTNEIEQIAPDGIRYEFTVETGEEINQILNGVLPAGYTRGHFHRGVE